MRVPLLSGVLMLAASVAMAQAQPGGGPSPQTGAIPTPAQSQPAAGGAAPTPGASQPAGLGGLPLGAFPPMSQAQSGSPTPQPASGAGQNVPRVDQMTQAFRAQVESELRTKQAELLQMQAEIQRLQTLDQRLQMDGPR